MNELSEMFPAFSFKPRRLISRYVQTPLWHEHPCPTHCVMICCGLTQSTVERGGQSNVATEHWIWRYPSTIMEVA